MNRCRNTTSPSNKSSPPPVEQTSRHAIETGASENKSLVAVLVDYDNVIGVARSRGFEVSFAKLRNFCRDFGRVIYADVFLSPTAAHKPDVITLLWQSGFEVFFCPMQSKDKDAVDAKLKARVRKYAEYASVCKLIIVSDDGDFLYDPELHAFVQDLGKELIVLRPSYCRAQLGGTNPVFENTALSRGAEDFLQCLALIGTSASGSTPEDNQRASFVRDVIRSIRIVSRGKKLAFKGLLNAVWDHANMSAQWRTLFDRKDLRNLLSALVNTSVLTTAVSKNSHNRFSQEFTYYALNQAHTTVMHCT